MAAHATRELVGRAIRHLELQALERRNRGFRTGLGRDPSAPAILLSPHFDDAVLNCWSVLSDSAPVTVINVFTALPRAGVRTTWDAICGASDSRSHMRQRQAEDGEALAPRAPVNLGFLDLQYRGLWSPPPTWRALDAALLRWVPAAARIYAPLGAVHPDHALVRRYATVVQRQRKLPLHLYADVPYAVTFGWPHWVRGVPRDDRLNVDAEWATWLQRVPELRRAGRGRVEELDAAKAAAKLAAMRRYRTQFSALDGGERRLLSNPAVLGYEVYWDVPGAGDAPAISGPVRLRSRAGRRRRSRTRTA